MAARMSPWLTALAYSARRMASCRRISFLRDVRQLSQPAGANGTDDAIGNVEHPECPCLAGQDETESHKTGTDGHQPAQAKAITEHAHADGDAPLGEACQ